MYFADQILISGPNFLKENFTESATDLVPYTGDVPLILVESGGSGRHSNLRSRGALRHSVESDKKKSFQLSSTYT